VIPSCGPAYDAAHHARLIQFHPRIIGVNSPPRSPQGEGGPRRASYGSASQPAIIIGKDSGNADAVLAPN
jgi:hypothetical protein